MAKLHPKPYAWKDPGFDSEANELNELVTKSNALPDREIVGGILKFPRADGHAFYLVTAKAPLTLQHVPFMDAYTIPPAYIRGLEENDAVHLVEQEKRWAKAFSDKSPNPGN